MAVSVPAVNPLFSGARCGYGAFMAMRGPRQVLITRPEPEAAETARDVAARGFAPLMAPLLSIRFLPFSLPDDCRALAFTSVNGVRAAARQGGVLSSLPVFCVGARTAAAARAYGWGDVRVADGNAASLSRLIGGGRPISSGIVVHLCGFDVSRNIESDMVSVERRVVYKAEAAAEFPADCLAAFDEGTIAAALFFSARTAEIFSRLVMEAGRTEALKGIKALCLADSVVKSLGRLRWRDVQVASRPDREALVALLGTAGSSGSRMGDHRMERDGSDDEQ